MRLKEFLICTLIFTIFYILLLIIYDFISLKILRKNNKRKAYKKIDENSFIKFAQFYGLTSSVSKDTLKKIYDVFKTDTNLKISDTSIKLGISNNEFVIILLFLEYLGLSTIRNINLGADITTSLTSVDQALVNKYKYEIKEKSDFNTINNRIGDSSNDLLYLDNRFIFPGVRIINKVIYYIGDIHEKK